MKGIPLMNSIPSFKASLLQNTDNKPIAPTVEEILGDSAVVENMTSPQEVKSGRKTFGIVSGALALTALGVLGRRGSFGKSIQKFLGGTPKLSAEQIQEQIASKISDYITRTENTPFTIKALANGKTTATRVLANGEKEIVLFGQNTGTPEFRVVFAKSSGDKALNYTTYKGADVLDDGFDTVNNFYKKYSRDAISRKHIFGLKQNKAKIVYGEQVRGDGTTEVLRHTTYYRNGDINTIVEQDSNSGVSIVRDMLYGKDKKIKGLDVISSDGTIIRKLKGANPILVQEPNRLSSRWQKILEFFSMQKRNIIE